MPRRHPHRLSQLIGSRGLIGLFPALFFFAFASADDSYHSALRDQLRELNIQGGSWVFFDQEQSTLNLAGPTNVQITQKPWTGPEPFTRRLEMTTSTAAPNPWDAAVRFQTQAPIAKGDALLLVIWVRRISANDGAGYMSHIFEQTSSPYTKSLALDQTPAPEWQQWMLPFEAEMSHNAGQARYQINLGNQAQRIEVAGLALLNFQGQYGKSDLPRSRHDFDYPGRAADAPWRAEALSRIEQIRKAPLRVRVVDARGRPLPGAEVQVEMKAHSFGFGTALSMGRMLGNTADDQKYRGKIFNLNGDGKTWSMIVFENALKWPDWENEFWEGTRAQVVSTVRALGDAGIRVRGHNLVWPSYQFLPQDISTRRNDLEYVRGRIHDHIFEIAAYPGLKGEIAEWDVLNEPAHLFDLRDLFGGEEVYADWFKWAAEADPDAKLYINEYSVISGAGKDLVTAASYHSIIQGILSNGGRIDGIGVQGHMNSTLTGPETIYQIFDQFAVYGAALSVTEFDAAGADEELLAEYLRDLLIICFSHPQVENFLMWGFWDGSHWHNDAPLYRRDWTEKPAGRAFLQTVFEDWWTSVAGPANHLGSYTVRGFLGHYEIEASYQGERASRTMTLGPEGASVEIVLETGREPVPRSQRDSKSRGWR
jgi:endo-1,4-beta-xylanase